MEINNLKIRMKNSNLKFQFLRFIYKNGNKQFRKYDKKVGNKFLISNFK